MQSYYGCCGMCLYCNLYNKNGSHFKCTEVSGRWVLATEKACSRFKSDPVKTYETVEKARENRLYNK